jgi:hypothetical protein
MPMSRSVTVLTLLIALTHPATEVAGQTERLFRSIEVQAGKTVRLGVYGRMTRNCVPGAPPEIRIVVPPKRGALAIRDGRIKTNRLAKCPDIESRVRGVFYQAGHQAIGPDQVTYEVSKPDGNVQAHSITITITPLPNAAPRPGEVIEL